MKYTTLEDWRKLLANRQDQLRRLEEVDAPKILIDRQKKMIEAAKDGIKRFMN